MRLLMHQWKMVIGKWQTERTECRTALFISLLGGCLGKVVRDNNKVAQSFVELFKNAVCSHYKSGKGLHKFMIADIIHS